MGKQAPGDRKQSPHTASELSSQVLLKSDVKFGFGQRKADPNTARW